MTTGSQAPRLSRVEMSLGPIEPGKPVLWPALALVAFFSFSRDVKSVMAELPYLLRRAGTVTIGGLKLQLTLELSAQAPAEVRRPLNGMPDDSLARRLQLHLAKGYVVCAQTHYQAEYNATKRVPSCRVLPASLRHAEARWCRWGPHSVAGNRNANTSSI